MKVSLFSTCLVDVFEKRVGIATVELLEKLGCEVDFREHKYVVGSRHITLVIMKRRRKLLKI